MPLNLFVNQLKTNLTLAKLFILYISSLQYAKIGTTGTAAILSFPFVSSASWFRCSSHTCTHTRKYYSRIRIWRMRMVDCRVHGTCRATKNDAKSQSIFRSYGNYKLIGYKLIRFLLPHGKRFCVLCARTK